MKKEYVKSGWSTVWALISGVILVLTLIAFIVDVRTTNDINVSWFEYVLLFTCALVSSFTSFMIEASELIRLDKMKAKRKKELRRERELLHERERRNKIIHEYFKQERYKKTFVVPEF